MDFQNSKTVEYLPVVKNRGSLEVVGILEHKSLVETIHRKLLEQRGGDI